MHEREGWTEGLRAGIHGERWQVLIKQRLLLGQLLLLEKGLIHLHHLGVCGTHTLLLDVLENDCWHMILRKGVDQLLKALVLNLEIEEQLFQMVNIAHDQVVRRDGDQSSASLLRKHLIEVTLLINQSLVPSIMEIRAFQTSITLFFIARSRLV